MAGLFVAVAWTSKPTTAAVARSITVLACALAYVFFWAHIWQTGQLVKAQRRLGRSVPREQAALAGLPPEPGIQPLFAEWIRPRLEPGESFFMVPSSTRDEGVYQWFTYRLLPHLSSELPEQADWLIFYGITPRESPYGRFIHGQPEEYKPGYSIARTRRES